MSDSGELDAQLSRAGPPTDDLEARDQLAELESRLFGKPREPIRVGRHLVLQRVGSGGLGVVYAAYDPELDRRVALKLLRPGHGTDGSGKSSSDARARLLREAQALARLSHPNVITVYDVGTWEDEVYIAMELVSGHTLAEWLGARERPWREVVAVFVGAGRGLAAAHEAGLVHRDFKPANVLVADDGRVRVLDFGLAKSGAAPPSPREAAPRPAASVADPSESGAMLGTPAYMAPEQYGPGAIDARADQYAFCVALWEALYGQRPFAGATAEQLARRKRERALTEPDRQRARRIPEHLRALVRRGLSPRPDDRFVDMNALLAVLERDPTRTRRRVGVALLGAMTVTGAALAAWPAREDRCAAIVGRIDAVWSPGTRAQLAAAFASVGKPYADAAWTRAQATLDAYATAWSDRRARSCAARLANPEAHRTELATEVCLERRLQDLAEVIRVLEVGDPEVVEHAVYAVASLPALSTCDAQESTREAIAAGDEARLEIDRLQSRGQALLRAGKYDDALAVARAADEQAAQRGYLSGRARARVLEGTLLATKGATVDAETALREAVALAETAADDDAAAHAATELFYVVGVDAGRHDEAHHWAELARAKIARRGDPTHLLGEYMNALGVVLAAQGRHAEAEAAHTEALTLRRGQGDEHDVLSASSLNNLGSVALSRGDAALAREYYGRALAAHEASFGPEHPTTALCRENLANALAALDQHDEATAQHERALAIFEGAFGHEHRTVIMTLNNLGTSLRRSGQLDRARAVLEEALALDLAVLGADHPLTFTIHTNLGEVLLDRGDPPGAIGHHEAAIAGLEARYGRDHGNLVYPLVGAARAYVAQGRTTEARAALLRAQALFAAGLGEQHPMFAEVRALLAALPAAP